MESLLDLETLRSKKFDMILSVEAWHTVPNTSQVLEQAQLLLD